LSVLQGGTGQQQRVYITTQINVRHKTLAICA
jgi:hypothetical protein